MIPELMSQVVIGDRSGFLCAGIIFQDLFCPQSSLGRDFLDAEVVEDCTPTNRRARIFLRSGGNAVQEPIMLDRITLG